MSVGTSMSWPGSSSRSSVTVKVPAKAVQILSQVSRPGTVPVGSACLALGENSEVLGARCGGWLPAKDFQGLS